MKLFQFLTLMMVIGVSPAFAEEHFEKEDQSPTGKFLNATEVRPILGMTKGNWIAVREFNGQDLLYFTHLLSWRCGLHQIKFSVNDGAQAVWPIPDCNPDNPHAIPDEAQVYLNFPLGSIETVTVDLLYDDMQSQTETFSRKDVQTP